MTIAISLLVHGEAVRFNRGQSRGDDFDFKYMRGRDGKEYPYVSSQCYKKYWRESLPGPFSPITREKDAKGKEKNQAYTDGNPVKYVDDDLFGYMIAGAAELEEQGDADAQTGIESPEDIEKSLFTTDNIAEAEALRKKLLDTTNPLSQFILNVTSAEARQTLQSSESPTDEIQQALVEALNDAVKSEELYDAKRFEKVTGLGPVKKKLQKASSTEEKLEAKKSLLGKAFAKELQLKEKRPTTRRTAPIRMHALVAFSGIKTAKDFQTFSRDVVYTGKNSIVNPTPQGIYSGWLKTRILIESHRIGKFYLGPEHGYAQRSRARSRDQKRAESLFAYVRTGRLCRTRRVRTNSALARGAASTDRHRQQTRSCKRCVA
jgi:hypothetical protein